MKKLLKALLILGICLISVAAIAAAYVYFFLPNTGKPTELKVDITPERIEKGKYMATSVAVCIDCHSTRDWTLYSGPITPGTYGKGGETFNRNMGFPGSFYSRNITPAALGSWTDGELFRAITTGVSKDGTALFPLMPYQHYGKADKEDIYDIIAYIRSLQPIDNKVAVSKADFPVNILMHLAPEKASFVNKPAESDTVRYGEYLVNMASCVTCHSKENKGEIIKGTEFGGGREFIFPSGTVRSMNITLHSTGIAYMNQEQFIRRFTVYKDSAYQPVKVQPEKDFNTPMPWTMYAHMKESDLAAIYAFLKTVKPIDNKVEKFSVKQ